MSADADMYVIKILTIYTNPKIVKQNVFLTKKLTESE